MQVCKRPAECHDVVVNSTAICRYRNFYRISMLFYDFLKLTSTNIRPQIAEGTVDNINLYL